MELVFEGDHSRDEIQAKLDQSFALYGLEPTEDNYRHAGEYRRSGIEADRAPGLHSPPVEQNRPKPPVSTERLMVYVLIAVTAWVASANAAPGSEGPAFLAVAFLGYLTAFAAQHLGELVGASEERWRHQQRDEKSPDRESDSQ
jgi:hypothetical protein